MADRRLFLAIGLALLCPLVMAGPFYSLESATSMSNISAGISINDKGTVAFVAKSGPGEAIFIQEGNGSPMQLTTGGFVSSDRFFNPAVQINNARRVVARDRYASDPPAFFIRLWSGQNPGTFEVVARGTEDADFLNVLTYASVNDYDLTAFLGFDPTGQLVLATTDYRNNFLVYPNQVIRPMTAATANFLCYRTTLPSLQLVRANQSFTQMQVVAGTSGGFTELGMMPGISDDGLAVGFVGNRGNGRGVFLGVFPESAGQPFQLIRVAGENQGAAGPYPELGYDVGSADIIHFSSLELDTRIGVIRVAPGISTLEGPTYMVSFLGKPSKASPYGQFTDSSGLFVIPIAVRYTTTFPRERVLYPQFPLAVAQTGDATPAGTITGFAFNDPLARASTTASGLARAEHRNDHRVAFANGSTGIVRALHMDHLAVIPHTQGGLFWGNDIYDHRDDVTIADKGCAMTSICMGLTFIGVTQLPVGGGTINMDPGNFNQYLQNYPTRSPGVCYGPNGNVQWVQIANVFNLHADGVNDRRIRFNGATTTLSSLIDRAASDGFLTAAITAGYPVVVGVNSRRNGSAISSGHFILVTGIAGTDFTINDPGNRNKRLLSSYADYDIRGYYAPARQMSTRSLRAADTPTTSAEIPGGLSFTVNDAVDIVVTDPNGLRTGIDNSTAPPTVYREIPGTCFFMDGLGTVNEEGYAPPDEYTYYLHINGAEEGDYSIALTGRDARPHALRIQGMAADDSFQIPINKTETLSIGQVVTITYPYCSVPIPPQDASSLWTVR